MKLSIKELIDGRSSRLRYVFRYSTTRVNHQESVAEHSYFVGFYCFMIGQWVNQELPSKCVNIEKLLTRALLHDLEEARSGDFPREFKHSSPKLKELLNNLARDAFVQVIQPLCGDPVKEDVSYKMVCAWEESKDDTIEGLILEFADFLAVLGYMMQEGACCGNRIIKQHVDNMDKYFHMFDDKKFNFIRSLIKEAGLLLEEMIGGNDGGS